jgi:acetylornithine deacetylase/succinyl-diaminopimelate desuccinylase-like protein
MKKILSLLLLSALCFSAVPQAPAQTTIDWPKINDEAVAKLRDYLRIDTQNPPGNELRGAEWLAKIFQSEGIPYEIAESASGRGNIVARLKATVPNPQPALILLSHIDVVPVNREYWTAEPFAGEVRDAQIWGRGAVDMKSQAIAQLMAFLLLHRMKTPLARDVIFLATADEEAGAGYGAAWVAENRPQWYAGAKFLLNEGARSIADPNGRAVFFGLGPTEKTPAWLRLTATGTPGHGSVPRPNSAVNKLVAALEKLRTWQPPLEVTPPIEQALASQAPFASQPWSGRLANIREFIARPEARAELAKTPGILALLTNTVSITMLEGSKKVNVIPPVATAEIDCRLLPGWTVDRWIGEVRRIIGDESIKIDVVLNHPWSNSSLDTPLYRAIVAAVKKLEPQAGVAQSISTGFTDSHLFRERGIASYGFGPFAMSDEISVLAHGNDERIPVAAFQNGVRLMWEVVSGFAAR